MSEEGDGVETAGGGRVIIFWPQAERMNEAIKMVKILVVIEWQAHEDSDLEWRFWRSQ